MIRIQNYPVDDISHVLYRALMWTLTSTDLCTMASGGIWIKEKNRSFNGILILKCLKCVYLPYLLTRVSIRWGGGVVSYYILKLIQIVKKRGICQILE